MGLEEEHDLLDLSLLEPCLGDALAPDRSDPGDLGQAFRFLIDDLQGGEPELFDQPGRHHLADPAHQAGTKIALDADQGRRLHGHVGLDPELLAVLPVAYPAPAELDRLSGLDAEEIPDRGHRLAPARDRHPDHGPAVVLVGVDDPVENPGHESSGSALHRKAELCSACHTLIHPHNGLVIENTYSEWKKSEYAKAGIQCQDCHMRTVEQALEVARTMKPVKVPGRTTEDDKRPDVKAHLFVGANTNGEIVGLGSRHVEQARARLRGAARLELELGEGKVVVSVTNISAGHAIPTSITELRQVWIDLSVTDASGKEVFRSGAIDENGRVDPKAVMYHSVLVDKEGKVPFKPWAAEKMIKEKLIGPRETVRETYTVPLPDRCTVRAVLRYRSAPQEVMDELFGKGKYKIDVVDMAEAELERR